MPPERQRLNLLLGALTVTLIGAAAYELWPTDAPVGPARAPARSGARGSEPAAVTAPDVHLQALRGGTALPAAPLARDLFRFKPTAPPPRPPRAATAPEPVTSPPPPPPPSGPPAIPMRFIGLVEAPQQAQKIAVLSDGRGIYQGREGDIIEGRYRILRIGVESVDMAYVDGRGRQTIRLSGS
jgi:hypothetical protein